MDDFKLRQLTQQASFHPIEGGAVVYHAGAQRIFALNTAAALVWLDVRDGATAAQSAQQLVDRFGLDGAEAARWVELALASFGSEGLSGRDTDTFELPAATTSVATPHSTGIDYHVLDHTVRIDAPDSAAPWIDSLLGSLRQGRAEKAAADLAIVVRPSSDGYDVTAASETVAAVNADNLAAAVEKLIVENIVPLVPHFLSFHAALLKKGTQAVLFPAPSGSGKTTLTARLAARGWDYGSDEMAFLGRDLRWQGLPFPPCIKAESYPLVRSWHGGLDEAREHQRFGRRIKFLPLASTVSREDVRMVVFPRYEPTASSALEPMRPLDGLARLLGQCIYVPPGLDSDAVRHLIRWHDHVAYFDMNYRDLDAVVDILVGRMSCC